MILLAYVGLLASIPYAFASENLFYGTSSLERFPSLIVTDDSQIIEIKFQYQEGPYSLTDLKPIIDVNPKEAAPFVHLEFEPVEGIYRNSIARIYGTITVDPNITSEKIFLNISYFGTNSIDEPFKSGWNDSAIIDIRENLSGAVLDKTVYPILSPLRQFKSGVPVDEIQCKDNFVLLQKHNGSPACVKPSSVIDLIKRNWMTTEEIDGYAIDYNGDVKHLPFADICTDEMKIILLTHSNISLPDEEFVMEDVGLPIGMNHEDFERCAHETSFTKSKWNMVSMENPEPYPAKCKSGPAPSEDHYFDEETCR